MYSDQRHIDLQVGQVLRIDSQTNIVRRMIVQLTSGTMDIFRGDFPSPVGDGDWRVVHNWPPQEIWFPDVKNLVLTLVGVKDRALGTILLMG